MLRKTVIRAAVFTLFVLFSVARMNADTIQLDSTGGTGQFNSNGATISVAPDALWASALAGSTWVSYAPTTWASGANFTHVANGTTVNFFDVFNVAGTVSGGMLYVMADDTATVLLNGNILYSGSTMTGSNNFAICSNVGIGCLNAVPIILPTNDFLTGTNTLEFEVSQVNGGSFGLDYSGYVTDPVSTPEPGSAMLLGLGLLTMGVFAASRKYANVLA